MERRRRGSSSAGPSRPPTALSRTAAGPVSGCPPHPPFPASPCLGAPLYFSPLPHPNPRGGVGVVVGEGIHLETVIWPPAASAPGPAARVASDVWLGCPGDLLCGPGREQVGRMLGGPRPGARRGTATIKTLGRKSRKGRWRQGATPEPLQSLGFFSVVGYHDLTPTMCKSACSVLFISHISTSFYPHSNSVRSIPLLSTSYSQGRPCDLHKVTR